jgi:hypothetical protein
MEGWTSPDRAHEVDEVALTSGESGTAEPLGRANRLAVTALICACVIGPIVGGILATVFGMVALDEIDESEGQERGQGMAKWAIGLGFVNILVSCVAIVLAVAVVTD